MCVLNSHMIPRPRLRMCYWRLNAECGRVNTGGGNAGATIALSAVNGT
jgi:hypothetical protein